MTNKHIEKSRYATLRHRRSATIVLAMIMLLGGLSSCTKDTEGKQETDTLVEILPQAKFAAGGIDIETSNANNPQTKAPVDGNTSLNLYFSRADETASGTYGDWSATAFSGTRATGTGAQPITFSTPTQYYMPGGGTTPLKTKIAGWYPGGATENGDITGNGYYDATTHTVSWTLDGTQDIMTAFAKEGSRTNAMPTFEFKHKLTQLIFCPYAETQEIADFWGKITMIVICNQYDICTYDIASDADTLIFTNFNDLIIGDETSEGEAMSVSLDDNKETNVKPICTFMINPTDEYRLEFLIFPKNRPRVEISVTRAFLENTAYKIFLKFTSEEVSIAVPSITPWQDGYTHKGDDIEI